jgi:ComF family protein
MIRWLRRFRHGISRLATAGGTLLFPVRCICCDVELPERDGDCSLCVDCLTRLAPTMWNGCRRCAGAVPECGFLPERCLLCKDVPLKFDAAVTLGSYHAGLRQIVLRMKRPSHDALSVAMGRLLGRRRFEQLREHKADVVVPIPMFWARRLGRGANSPDVLARCLGKSLGIPVRRDILIRRRNTLPQAQLPPSRRFQNVQGAFRIRRSDAARDARILLVDDVLTTGATCSEAAKTLKQAGAAYVAVAVVARTQGG